MPHAPRLNRSRVANPAETLGLQKAKKFVPMKKKRKLGSKTNKFKRF